MATVEIQMHSEQSSGSNCSSERIAPYVYRTSPSYALTSAPSTATCSIPSHTKSTFLDETTKSRLIQLYTARKPITNPKKIQAHFTCLYLTRANIDDVLRSRSNHTGHHGLRYSSASSPYASRFTDLSKLIQHSWRVTFGTLSFLELIWTGHRAKRDWDSVLSASSDQETDTDSTATPCPQSATQEEYLALNMAVTYYYSPEGQPTLSLAAIAMTKDAFDTINTHAQQHSQRLQQRSATFNTSSSSSGASAFPILDAPPPASFQPIDFSSIPFVHRDLLVPTLCRWRNADVQSIITLAAEGRAWAARLVRGTSASADDEMDVEVEGTWLFPTIKTDGHESPQAQPPPPTTTDINMTTDLVDTPTSDLSTTDSVDTSTRAQYELRAALVPGRDAVFRTIASRLGNTMDRSFIRRSSQIPLAIHTGASPLGTYPVGMGKRRRET